jgi:phage tail tube protein FII
MDKKIFVNIEMPLKDLNTAILHMVDQQRDIMKREGWWKDEKVLERSSIFSDLINQFKESVKQQQLNIKEDK